MKVKSFSVENLGNIVKQIINTALEDSDQIAKLHQAIYEEWYFKKMMELGDATSKTKNAKDIRKISQEISYPLSNLTRNISNRGNSMDEVWNNPMQRAKIKKKLESTIIDHQNGKQNEGKLLKHVKRRLSFESWKEGKNLMYGKVLKEAEEKKQRELQKNLKDIKYIKTSQETQIIKTKEDQQRRELSVKQLQVIQQTNMETLQKQIDERCTVNDQAFNAWKKRKDMKLKEAKLIMMKNALYHQVKKSVGPSITFTEKASSEFDSWLDQLNHILHQKYLRERRHLVRSFYCQPTYYGAAPTCYI